MDLTKLAEDRYFPDWLIRLGIRRLLSRRLKSESVNDVGAQRRRVAEFVDQLKASPLAVSPDKANDQHYEVPADFFRLVLGPRLKYSCCLYEDAGGSLRDAEQRMLDLTCARADIADGMDILELGCGWGSLTLWIAEQFPGCRVTAVSNSHGQREFIESRCRMQGLTNVHVITEDISDFETDRRFDRVVSLEMFEHLRNYQLLFQRISGWLNENGKLFAHIFCHRDAPYLFETEGAANWMGREFFSGGMMPSDDLLLYFQDDLAIQQHWRVSGLDYARTSEAWLRNLDGNRERAVAVFKPLVGKAAAAAAVQRWRMFFMACAELFRYRNGNQWYVSHYLFENRASDRGSRSAPAEAILTA